MADEGEALGQIKDRAHALRIEDRHPAEAEPFGARGEPQRMDGGDHRIIERLGHGYTAESRPFRGRPVREHRDLARRVVEAGELEPRIERPAAAVLLDERVLVAGLEALAD